MRIQYILAAALVAACAAPAVAMPGASGTDRFTAMDINSDGRVVWEEFEKGMPQMRREAFSMIDLNKDDALTREEWDAFRQNHGMQQGKPGMSGMSGKPDMSPEAPEAPAGKPLIQPPKN